MRAYSLDLRERVLQDRDGGMSQPAVAQKYRVSARWIHKLEKQREETGDIAPRRGKPGPAPKLAQHTEELMRLVDEHPDATLCELRDRLSIAVCTSTVWSTLRSLGVTLKKGLARC
jgi:transposase